MGGWEEGGNGNVDGSFASMLSILTVSTPVTVETITFEAWAPCTPTAVAVDEVAKDWE